MGEFKFTKDVLGLDENQEAIASIENILGRSLQEDEVLQFDSGLCNGKECPAGYICVLGNCVKDDSPTDPGQDQ